MSPVSSQYEPLRPGIDPTAQPAERGVRIDGDHPVLPAQLGENGPDTGGDCRLADTAFAQHPHLVVAAQRGADDGCILSFLAFSSRRTRVDHAERANQHKSAPAAHGLRAVARRPEVLPGRTGVRAELAGRSCASARRVSGGGKRGGRGGGPGGRLGVAGGRGGGGA